MTRKLLAVLAGLFALQLASSCRSGDPARVDSGREEGPEAQAPGVLPVSHESGAQREPVVAAAGQDPPPEERPVPVVQGLEHLLQPFELFAPNEAVGEASFGSLQLATPLDPCDRNAPGKAVRQQPLLYGPSQPPGSIRSEFFEGVGGLGIEPSCFHYGEAKAHGYVFPYLARLTERDPEKLVTWNEVPGLMSFRATSRLKDAALQLEVRAEPAVKTGETYWLDHCVGQDSVIFNERSRYYYFNPEPVEIDLENGQLGQQWTEDSALKPLSKRGPVQVDVVLNPQVDSWWEDLSVEGQVEPYLLVHQPRGNLNVLLYWQDAALLKVNWQRCIHVNPALIANGKPQTLRGELYVFRGELRQAHAFVRAHIAR